jgi:phage-related protein
MPEAKTSYESLPDSDSDYDFSEFNEDGRLHYNDRVFEGTISVVGKNMTEIHNLLTKVARWLFGGWKTLEFDDMPGTVWTAKVENTEVIGYELSRIGTASVYFRVKPFSKWFLDSAAGGVPLDTDKIDIDSGIPIDLDLNPTYPFAQGSQSITINNLGDWYTNPILTVTGNFTQLTFAVGDKQYTYSGSIQTGDTLIIDCEKPMATKNGLNIMPLLSGTGLEFSPGSNELSITSDGTGQVTVTFDFKFINGAVINYA